MPLGIEARSHAGQRRFGRQRQSGGPVPPHPSPRPQERVLWRSSGEMSGGFDSSPRGRSFSLSFGERAGVRGTGLTPFPQCGVRILTPSRPGPNSSVKTRFGLDSARLRVNRNSAIEPSSIKPQRREERGEGNLPQHLFSAPIASRRLSSPPENSSQPANNSDYSSAERETLPSSFSLHCYSRDCSQPAKKRRGFPFPHCPIPGNSDLFRISDFRLGRAVLFASLRLSSPSESSPQLANNFDYCSAERPSRSRGKRQNHKTLLIMVLSLFRMILSCSLWLRLCRGVIFASRRFFCARHVGIETASAYQILAVLDRRSAPHLSSYIAGLQTGLTCAQVPTCPPNHPTALSRLGNRRSA